jgi:hypothetical protein
MDTTQTLLSTLILNAMDDSFFKMLEKPVDDEATSC